jgi:phage repressor protein C with HTH and peptisase S24 domain
MAPTLASGDYMILTKTRSLRPGFVVLVDHPKYGLIVKRVKGLDQNQLTLEGDAAGSTSTEAMGRVDLSKVKGRVRWAITPKGLKRL